MKRALIFAAIPLSMIVGFAVFDADPSGCDGTKPTADAKTTEAQETMLARSVDQVGLPNIIHFTEKRRAKRIYELRDQAGVETYTYQYDMMGHLHFFCNSIGYPLPYATQYSSAERVAKSGETPYSNNVTLPQAEPNGLFMPAEAHGTWVECINPKNPNETGVAYSEPDVVAMPWPMTSTQ